jgi:hypothetical protein
VGKNHYGEVKGRRLGPIGKIITGPDGPKVVQMNLGPATASAEGGGGGGRGRLIDMHNDYDKRPLGASEHNT